MRKTKRKKQQNKFYLFITILLLIVSCKHKNTKEHGFPCLDLTYSLPDYLNNEYLSYINKGYFELEEFCEDFEGEKRVTGLNKYHFNQKEFNYSYYYLVDDEVEGNGNVNINIGVCKSYVYEDYIGNFHEIFEKTLSPVINYTEVDFLGEKAMMVHGEVDLTNKGVLYRMFVGGKFDEKHDMRVEYSMYCDTCSVDYHKDSFIKILSTFR